MAAGAIEMASLRLMEAQTSEPTRMLVQVSFRKPRWWRRGAGPALTTAGRVCKFWLICRPDRSLPSGFRLVDIKVLLNNAYERTFNDFDITSPVNADQSVAVGPMEMRLASAGPHWLELHIDTTDARPIEARQMVHEGEEGRGWWQGAPQNYLRTPIEVREWATSKILNQNRVIISLTALAVVLALLQVFTPQGFLASMLKTLVGR